jgi:hypothetical protein
MDLDPIIDLLYSILTSLDEGGDGSGNFGHAGVPGQQGGSADSSQSNPVVGKTSWAGTEIYKIENASNLTSYGAIVVSKTGTEVLATREEEFHSDIVESTHPGSTVDDYVRFVSKDGVLTSNNMSAGITVDNAEENSKAVDLIYKALDKLVALGLPGDTEVVIQQGTYGSTITTTAEVWTSEEFQSNLDRTIELLYGILTSLNEGGDGSGNFEHEGVPGQQGGSASGGGSKQETVKSAFEEQGRVIPFSQLVSDIIQ